MKCWCLCVFVWFVWRLLLLGSCASGLLIHCVSACMGWIIFFSCIRPLLTLQDKGIERVALDARVIITIIIIGKGGAYHPLGLLHHDRKLDFTAYFILISDHTSSPHVITNSVTCFAILHSVGRVYKVKGMFIPLLSSIREERWGSYCRKVSRKWLKQFRECYTSNN